MNKTAIKNYAVWAREKLIRDVCYRAQLVGITESGIQEPLPASDKTTEFYDIGTGTPYILSGERALRQRRNLAAAIRRRARESDYPAAYQCIMEEVAYTWFNRLIAVRFMEVNDYLPSRMRALSSESGKVEPDLVSRPFDADFSFSREEEAEILRLREENRTDELFRLLFIKQCNALSKILPALFENAEDYTELLLNLSVVDQDGVVWRLTHDIPEEDFNVSKGGQVEIIGWLYQYYNTEPKAKVFARPSGQKIKKEEIPAATQLFTPHWIVKYMVENSLGRLWLEGHPDDELRAGWRYYIDEAEQEPEVQRQLDEIRQERRKLKPEEIKIIDPCMGSGHILVYAFDVLMQIYEKAGWERREAVRSIVENNLYGLDIDKRAWQLAYFAVMMKAREYDRRFLTREIEPHIYEVESSGWTGGKYPLNMGNFLLSKEHQNTVNYLLEACKNAKEYGSLLQLEQRDYKGLLSAWKYTASQTAENVNMVLWYDEVENLIPALAKQAIALTQKYNAVVTNPPYMGGSGMNGKLAEYVKKNFPYSKADLFSCFMERADSFVLSSCYTSLITMESWMFLSSFEKLRKKINQTKTIINMVHMPYLGKGGTSLGINFGTAAVIMQRGRIPNYSAQYEYTVYYECDENGVPFVFPTKNEWWRTAKQDNFSKIPGAPVAYWVSGAILQAFESKKISDYCHPRQGFATGDNERFLRFWYEVDINRSNLSAQHGIKNSKKWFPCNKGGEYRKWYGNNLRFVNWENDGQEMKNFSGSVIRNPTYYFRSGITWSTLGSASLSMRYSPVGFLFESKGSVCFFNNDSDLPYILGLVNSKVVYTMLLVLAPTLDFHEGPIGRIPVIECYNYRNRVNQITSDNISISHADWDSFETSWDFTRHPLVRGVPTVAEAFAQWEAECTDRFQQLKANEEELNRIFIDIYGLQDELTPEVEDKDVTVRRADLARDIRSLLSYAVGCIFGRYSLDAEGLIYAGGDWDAVYQHDFLCTHDGERILTHDGEEISISNGPYRELKQKDEWIDLSFSVNEDNIIPLTDEPYLESDIITRFCEWLCAAYAPEKLEENLAFIAQALGNKGASPRETIRAYFLKEFYANHCKIYQKRPIYWLFDSGKQNGFKALIYLHRYDEDTIGRLRLKYLQPIMRIYASEIDRMQDVIDSSANKWEVVNAAKRREKLQKQLKECREYDEKIGYLALARISLDLDDGVKVNYEKLQTADKKYPVLGKI